MSACAGGGDEIEAALTALKSDVDDVGAGLEVDANEVKARIVEGVQLLLPLCSFLAPSIRGRRECGGRGGRGRLSKRVLHVT